MSKDFRDILDQLIFEYKGYSTTLRSNTQFYRQDLVNEFSFNDEIVRENLIEHVGHLPTIAIVLFPHLEEPNVDLGRVLTMLAIHDIGEIFTGDVNIFVKNKNDEKDERSKAMNYLNDVYKELYIESMELKTLDSKFAKSIDKLAPEILDLSMTPKDLKERYKEQLGYKPEQIVPAKREWKMKYMEWNPFMKEFYKYVLDETKRYIS